jgi:hypothetical protein
MFIVDVVLTVRTAQRQHEASRYWSTYTSPSGDFTVRLPGEIRPSTKDERIRSRDLEQTHCVAAMTFNGALVWISVMEPQRPRTDRQSWFDVVSNAFFGGPEMTKREISLNRIPGREFSGRRAIQGTGDRSLDGKMETLRARVYLVGNRIYSVEVCDQRGEPILDEEANQVFNSFQILAAPAVPVAAP